MRIPAGLGSNRYKESKENSCIWREMQGILSLRAVIFSDFFEFEGGNIPFCEIRILLRLTVYRRWIISSIRGFTVFMPGDLIIFEQMGGNCY